jgi:molecular chaperone GrpE
MNEQEVLESAEEEVEILDAPLEKYNEMLDKYQRCLAEFDNYRKRTVKEMASRYDDGIRAAAEKLLPIVDNFDRALSSCDNKDDTFFKGIEMIARQFDTMLDEMGVKSIAIEPGSPFDANFHHAVAHTQDESFGENEVAEILQKGYVHKERIIRPAMVKVAN